MSLQTKSFTAFGLIVALTVAVAVYGEFALSTTSQLVLRLYDEPLVAVNYARAARARLSDARAEIGRGIPIDAAALPAAAAMIQVMERETIDDLRIAKGRMRSEAGVAIADHAEQAVAMWFATIRATQISNPGGLTELPMPEAAKIQARAASALLDDLVETLAAEGYSYRVRAGVHMRQSGITLMILAGGIVVVGGIIVLLFGRLLINPIRAAICVAEEVAAGKSGSVISTGRRDEIGRLLRSLAILRSELFDRELRAGNLLMEREQVAEALRDANERFDFAINNMSHGLLMCGDDGRIVVVNRPYCELYGIDPAAVVPGCHYREVVALSAAAGNYPGRALDDLLAERGNVLAMRERCTVTRSVRDGRTISISYEPMGEGGWIAVHEEITERRRSEERINFLAGHDVLTGLPNRAVFQEKLADALTLATRGRGFALLCLDLDQFKSVNDTLGHPVGDNLLRAVADRLRGIVRETDTIARLGGDEFAILQLDVSGPEEASALARRLIKDISAPYVLDGERVTIGVSIGISLAPDNGVGAVQLFKNADLALYRAKQMGRGTFRLFAPEMDAAVNARRELERDLREALSQNQFELYYQPVVHGRTRIPTGFEALLRWHHPVRGMVSPDEFISVAEDIGAIIPIGAWVLRQACLTAATWPDHIRVAVNVSSRQFEDRSFTAMVGDAIQQAGIKPSRVELEITESVIMGENQTTLSAMHALRALGVRVAMDDFGTGYSSLSYLNSFPFDTIKIDKSFVNGVQTRKECAAIIRAITTLGDVLGMSTTAEGVETEEQLAILTEAGCTELQGYLFSKPVRADEIPSLTKRLSEAGDLRSSGHVARRPALVRTG